MRKSVGYYVFWYFVYFCSFIFVRNKKKYAFGGPQASFKDNAKYLFIYASEHCKDIDVAWITPYHSVVNNLRAMGLKAYHWRSAKGMWHALTSRYWFYNSYPSDINYYLSGGATCVEGGKHPVELVEEFLGAPEAAPRQVDGFFGHDSASVRFFSSVAQPDRGRKDFTLPCAWGRIRKNNGRTGH